MQFSAQSLCVLLGVFAGRLHPSSRQFAASWVEISPPHARFAARPAPNSDDTGTAGVYVQSFPEQGRPTPISTKGGILVQWRKDGKELYFLSPDETLMAAAVDGTGPVFQASPPQPLFKVRVPTRGLLSHYQPSDDGERFLVNTLSEQTSAPRTLSVVMNWQPLAKKK